MANNGARQGGGGGNGQMNEHVEFTVKVCDDDDVSVLFDGFLFLGWQYLGFCVQYDFY